MTTNGMLLKDLAQPLADAGLQRVNVSIDTLDPVRFKKITRWGSLDQVWEGIEAAERAGLTPVKLNAVVVRGFNDQDVTELAKLTLDHDWQVRFIEMMPFGDVATFAQEQIITDAEIRAKIADEYMPLELSDDGQSGRRSAHLSVPRRERAGRLHQHRQRAFLRHLQPRPPDRRRRAAPVPAAR